MQTLYRCGLITALTVSLMACYGELPGPPEDVTSTPPSDSAETPDSLDTPESDVSSEPDTSTPPTDGSDAPSGPDIPAAPACGPGEGPLGPSELTTGDLSCAAGPTATATPGLLAASTRNRLRWKRVGTLQRDLTRALTGTAGFQCDDLAYLREAFVGGLPFAEWPSACWLESSMEIGIKSAFDIHQVALGGNDPIDLAQYAAAKTPLATTPIAIDRVVMLACIAAVDTDALGQIAGSGIAVEDSTETLDEATLDGTTTLFYRQLLARDPLPEELNAMRTLAIDDAGTPITVRDFLVLSCFVTGTSSEFIFY